MQGRDGFGKRLDARSGMQTVIDLWHPRGRIQNVPEPGMDIYQTAVAFVLVAILAFLFALRPTPKVRH